MTACLHTSCCPSRLPRVHMSQMGKVHFGVILGWSVAQSVIVYFVANQVASNDGSLPGGLDLYNCCCVTGYGMVPLILVSAALLLVPRCVCAHTRGCCIEVTPDRAALGSEAAAAPPLPHRASTLLTRSSLSTLVVLLSYTSLTTPRFPPTPITTCQGPRQCGAVRGGRSVECGHRLKGSGAYLPGVAGLSVPDGVPLPPDVRLLCTAGGILGQHSPVLA
jgi:hypothetical protein